jgi:hypothetical protein
MLTEDQLADRLRSRLRHELAAVEPRPELLDDLRRRQARRTMATRASMVAVPTVAIAAAATLIVSAAGSGVSPSPAHGARGHSTSTVLTAAMVKRVASESRLALAHSGRATISYRMTENGKPNGAGSDQITFSGKNWNDVISGTDLGSKHPVAINRIVNGQFYLDIAGPDNRMRWYHDTNPSGHPDVQIPDPRTLFGMLNPSAQFKVSGHQVVGGVRLTKLRATLSPGIRPLSWLPGAAPGAHVDSLVIWVDRHQVVHQMSMRTRQTSTSDPLYYKKFKNGDYAVQVPSKAYLKQARAIAKAIAGKLPKGKHVRVIVDPKLPGKVTHHVQDTSVSVTFSGFGQRQVIRVPAHAVPQFARG